MQRCTRTLFVALLCVIAIAGGAFAQSVNQTTGAITGVITDSTGAPLPGVTVTVTNTQTGLTRTIVTELDGKYIAQLLPPGTYRVEASLEGLGTAQKPSAVVLLGNTTTADLSINPQLSEQITVTAAAPVVDVQQSGMTTSVTEEQIENLPILGRDFRALAQLTPGVNEAFGSRITAGGARGIATDFNIDGANATNDFFGEQTGGTRAPFTFSQAAIREFQVVRTQYSAEYGRGVGATINAITKSGTNDVDGEVFYFLRKRNWAATRPRTINGQTVEDEFRAKDSAQPGFAIGGPVLRDRLFYFVNADFQRQEIPVIPNDFRTDPDFVALPEATRTAYISKLESLLGYSIGEELASYPQTADQNTYLVKFDFNVGSSHHVAIRDNYSNFENQNNQNSFNFRSNQGNENNRFNQAVGNVESVLSPSLFNQFLLQFTTDERPIEPMNVVPTEFIVSNTGLSTMYFGNNDFLPNNTKETKWQIRNGLTWVVGDHNIKGGFEALLMNIENLFARNQNGVYRYTSIANFLDNRPNQYQQGAGPGGGLTTWDQNTYALFVHDTWRMDRLTLDAGLRYDYQTMPEPVTNIYTSRPEFVENFKEDRNNFAPRVGFAYDLTGNGRSVVRGGSGIFYNYLPSILLSNPLTQISGNFNQYTLNCSQVTCPTFPNILTPEQISNFNAASVLDITILSDNIEAQESWRSSLQFEQQVGAQYSVSVGGTFAKLSNVQALANINAVPMGYSFGNLPIYTSGGSKAAFPEFRDVRAHMSDEEATYTALTLETRKLALNNSNLSWNASYTWSRSIDQDTNERSTSSSFRYDPFNPELSEGPSQNDVPHRIVLSGTYRLPLGIMLSGIGTYRSGTPFTRSIRTSGAALNGLFSISESFPVFLDGNGEVIDLTQATGLTRPQFATWLAERGAVLEERNSQRQPYVKNIDLRLSKVFGLPRNLQLELIGEVFNVFNWDNRYITGANQYLYDYRLTTSTDKVSFTKSSSYGLENSYVSSINPRQFQVAAKIRF